MIAPGACSRGAHLLPLQPVKGERPASSSSGASETNTDEHGFKPDKNVQTERWL